jgi:hypothetical protein
MFMIYLCLGLQITIHTSSSSSWQTKVTKIDDSKLAVNTNNWGLALGIYLQDTFNLDKSTHNVEGTMHAHTKTHTMWLVLIFDNQHTWKNNLES